MTVLGSVSGEQSRLHQTTLVEPTSDIDALDGHVIRLFSLVGDGIAGATTSFLASARQAAALLVAEEEEEEEEVDAVATAIEMGLVARFLERLGDHAVNVARRLETLPGDE
jgi:hypothetical protein